MKQFYARYTPELVEEVTGVPKQQLLELAALYGATGQPGKAGTLLYAMGGTQHTTGVQIIRSYTLLQQLLGNMGVPGGGINALRGRATSRAPRTWRCCSTSSPGTWPLPARPPTHLEGLSGERDPQGQLLDQ